MYLHLGNTYLSGCVMVQRVEIVLPDGKNKKNYERIGMLVLERWQMKKKMITSFNIVMMTATQLNIQGYILKSGDHSLVQTTTLSTKVHCWCQRKNSSFLQAFRFFQV